MAIDGTFIHFLIQEIKPQIINKHISKLISINDQSYAFLLNKKDKFLINFNDLFTTIQMSHIDYINSPSQLTNTLKKHLENGIIQDLSQYHNDRIVIIDIANKDELGYYKNYKLILELTSRFANIILTDHNYYIIDALKKQTDINERLILPKVKYQFLESHKLNPFLANSDVPETSNIYEGVSKNLFQEFHYQNSIKKVLEQKLNPTIILGTKTSFYVFPLQAIPGEKISFSSISEMLDYYIINTKDTIIKDNEQKKLTHFINREITKIENKLEKQECEKQEAINSLQYEKIANILANNIHLVKKHQQEITVWDFYEDKEITIPLKTNIPITENINYYFNKYKKAKRSIEMLTETIKNTKNDLEYYKTLKQQLTIGNISDIKEIVNEVSPKKDSKKKSKPNYISYHDQKGNFIFVGKNNIQNEFLTFTLAKSNDYFFHVKSFPGCHVIFRGFLDEDAIKLASEIAAFHSKLQGPVTVDYTLIKWVKKIKGMKGSFVRYTNEKAFIATADSNYIKEHATLDK